MTISSEVRKAGPYDGNGTTTAFPFTFKVFAKGDVRVVRTTPAGVESTLVLDSDYSVTLNADQDNDPGGTITYPLSGAPLAVGWTLTATSDVAYTQTADITNSGAFYPQVLENALDRATIQIQQLREQVTNVQDAIAEVAAEAVQNAAAVPFTPTGTIASTNVQDAIAEVAAEAAGGGGTVIASDVVFTPTGTISATNVQAAIAEVASEAANVAAGGVTFTPVGTISATNVQDAIAEVAAEAAGGGVNYISNIAALRVLPPPADGRVEEVLGFYTTGDGGGGKFVYNAAATNTDDNGVVIRPSSMPATGRWVRADVYGGNCVNVRWYGAKGDGTTDDTTALQNAINAGQGYAKSIYIPAGTYITQPLTYPSTGYAAQVSIRGENMLETILKKKSGASTAPLLTIGSSGATNFTANLTVENITFDGLAKASTTDAVKSYDLVRSTFVRCTFKNSGSGYSSLGGIYITWRDCTFDANDYGMVVDKFTSLAGGGWPNGLTLEQCFLINNSTWGLWFDNGRMISLNQTEVEGNGTNGVSTTGGVRIGPNVGAEGGGSTPNSIALRARDLWCEANAGASSIVLLGGKNALDGCYFVANPQATYDIYVNGGTYRLEKCVSDTSKSPNFYEGASTSGPNWINACETYNISYSDLKTYIDYGETNRCCWSFTNGGADYSAVSGVQTEMTLGSTELLSGGTKVGNAFRATVAGIYRVNAQVQINAVGNGAYFQIAIYKNGALYKNGVTVPNSTGTVNNGQTTVSCLISLAANDTVSARYFTSAAGATVEGDASQTYFCGEKL